MGDGPNKRTPMTEKQYQKISDIKCGITTAKRLLDSNARVKVVQSISHDHIYEASGFYQVNREFGNKVAQVLENAEREIRSMLEAELARLESEFAGIIVGTELNPKDDE